MYVTRLGRTNAESWQVGGKVELLPFAPQFPKKNVSLHNFRKNVLSISQKSNLPIRLKLKKQKQVQKINTCTHQTTEKAASFAHLINHPSIKINLNIHPKNISISKTINNDIQKHWNLTRPSTCKSKKSLKKQHSEMAFKTQAFYRPKSAIISNQSQKKVSYGKKDRNPSQRATLSSAKKRPQSSKPTQSTARMKTGTQRKEIECLQEKRSQMIFEMCSNSLSKQQKDKIKQRESKYLKWLADNDYQKKWTSNQNNEKNEKIQKKELLRQASSDLQILQPGGFQKEQKQQRNKQNNQCLQKCLVLQNQMQEIIKQSDPNQLTLKGKQNDIQLILKQLNAPSYARNIPLLNSKMKEFTIFKNLPQNLLSQSLKRGEHQIIQANELVYQRHDQALFVYIILQGSIEILSQVYVTKGKADQLVSYTYYSGQYFGHDQKEQGQQQLQQARLRYGTNMQTIHEQLQKGKPKFKGNYRIKSARALQRCNLFKIPYGFYNHVLHNLVNLQQNKIKIISQCIPTLSNYQKVDILPLFNSFQPQKYKYAQYIYNQDKTPDWAFIIVSGLCSINKKQIRQRPISFFRGKESQPMRFGSIKSSKKKSKTIAESNPGIPLIQGKQKVKYLAQRKIGEISSGVLVGGRFLVHQKPQPCKLSVKCFTNECQILKLSRQKFQGLDIKKLISESIKNQKEYDSIWGWKEWVGLLEWDKYIVKLIKQIKE